MQEEAQTGVDSIPGREIRLRTGFYWEFPFEVEPVPNQPKSTVTVVQPSKTASGQRPRIILEGHGTPDSTREFWNDIYFADFRPRVWTEEELFTQRRVAQMYDSRISLWTRETLRDVERQVREGEKFIKLPTIDGKVIEKEIEVPMLEETDW